MSVRTCMLRRSTRRGRPSSGIVLAAVLVCLLIVALMAAGLAQALVLQSRQSRAQLRQLQAFWLAEAGLARAQQSLRSDPSYAGARWQMELEQDGVPRRGAVEVSVTRLPDRPDMVRIDALALWPHDPVDRAREQRSMILHLATTGETP